jgi:hypothetical protein
MTQLYQRHHDWPERLAEYIEGRRERPFSWGSNDCCLFFADAVLEMTGTDPAAKWRGYKSQVAATRRVKKAGGLRAMAKTVGLIEKHPGLAQRGDGVIVKLDGRETFGLVVGNGCWCGPGKDRLEFRPMSEATTAFGV